MSKDTIEKRCTNSLRASTSGCHGWVVLDKPLGLTSTQALGKVRRLVGGKKAGHGGTLDPLATGVLPLAFGEATKLIPYVMDSNKVYEFSIRWGEQRTTDDAEGDVCATSDCRPSEAEIRAALPQFIGEIDQTPPAFSAIKIDGQRAYDLARAGEAPVMVSRKVMIYGFDLIGVEGPNEASFRVCCGKGTYVRSLGRDLALILGTYGYISALRRTKTGAFTLAESISLEKLEDLSHKNDAMSAMLGLKAALDDIPGLNLSDNEAQSLRNGQSPLIKPHQLDLLNHPVIWAEYQGEPVALVEPNDGTFRILRGFHFNS